MGTVVKPLAGKSKALVDATARRFLVVGALLRQVPIAMDNYVKSLTSKPLLATIVWGMDETYQWVSMKAYAGTPSLSEFLCKAAVPWLSASVESFYICSFLVIVLGGCRGFFCRVFFCVAVVSLAVVYFAVVSLPGEISCRGFSARGNLLPWFLFKHLLI